MLVFGLVLCLRKCRWKQVLSVSSYNVNIQRRQLIVFLQFVCKLYVLVSGVYVFLELIMVVAVTTKHKNIVHITRVEQWNES